MTVDSHKAPGVGADAEAVERLVAAYDEPVGSVDTLPGIADPYAVQAAVVARRVELAAATPVGWKLAFTLEAPPAADLAAAPAYGRLLSDHLRPNGAQLSAAGDPLVECELLVRATTDLSGAATDAQLVAGLEARAMVEVPVSRFEHWWPADGAPRLGRAEFVADNCLAAYVVVGGDWVPLSAVDVDAVMVELSTPGGELVPGTAAAVMGSPLAAVRWFLREHGGLAAGDIVATGTMTPAARGLPGRFRARFSPPFGEVVVDFVAHG